MKPHQPVLKTAPKPEFERAVKRSVSMPGILFLQAQNKTRQRGLSTFSDYIQDLIRKDIGLAA